MQKGKAVKSSTITTPKHQYVSEDEDEEEEDEDEDKDKDKDKDEEEEEEEKEEEDEDEEMTTIVEESAANTIEVGDQLVGLFNSIYFIH